MIFANKHWILSALNIYVFYICSHMLDISHLFQNDTYYLALVFLEHHTHSHQQPVTKDIIAAVHFMVNRNYK